MSTSDVAALGGDVCDFNEAAHIQAGHYRTKHQVDLGRLLSTRRAFLERRAQVIEQAIQGEAQNAALQLDQNYKLYATLISLYLPPGGDGANELSLDDLRPAVLRSRLMLDEAIRQLDDKVIQRVSIAAELRAIGQSAELVSCILAEQTVDGLESVAADDPALD